MMSKDNSLNESRVNEKWSYQFPYIFGIVYIAMGIIALWESQSSTEIFWDAFIKSVFGIFYLLLGYFISKRSLIALWLMILAVTIHSVIYDIYLPIVIEQTQINLMGLFLTILWNFYALLVIRGNGQENKPMK